MTFIRGASHSITLSPNPTPSVAARVRCSWQGIDRSLVASARAIKISCYIMLLLPLLTARAEGFLPGHLLWHALVWRRHCATSQSKLHATSSNPIPSNLNPIPSYPNPIPSSPYSIPFSPNPIQCLSPLSSKEAIQKGSNVSLQLDHSLA